jgi:membrane protein implicated in regulation of membrane protease activity
MKHKIAFPTSSRFWAGLGTVLVIWALLLGGVWLTWSLMPDESFVRPDVLNWVALWVILCGLVAGLVVAIASWVRLPGGARRTPRESQEPKSERELPRKRLEPEPRVRDIEAPAHPSEDAAVWKFRCPGCGRTLHRYARICPHCRTRLR